MARYLVQAALAFFTAICVMFTAPVILEKKAAQGVSLNAQASKQKKPPGGSVETPEEKIAVILLHNGEELQTTENIINGLREKGYETIHVSQLVNARGLFSEEQI